MARTEVLPEARTGQRLVIAHRHRMWRLDRMEQVSNVLFTPNPVSPYLSGDVMQKVRDWLARRTEGRSDG